MSKLTLGSLFDGSGGFPLGALLNGIEPKWSSEIEPFPIRVTTKRMPQVKHLGDISKINGGEIELVDIITFGSPCQDMSVAGKRDGLDGSRSSLFYEAIRIVKEMRCNTNGKYPRYIVWENVHGAFSSNKGDDFRAVLEEICKIKDSSVSISKPKKWTNAGEILGDDFSLAWRVLDAQYWGVPQRRKRIYLVADFGGGSAGKILFESESLSRNIEQSKFERKETAANVGGGIEETSLCIDGYNGAVSDKASTLGINCGMSTGRNGVIESLMFENHSQDCRYRGPLEKAQTVSATYGTGGNNQPFVVETPKTMKVRCGCEGGGKGALIQDNKSATLSCNNDQTLFEPVAYGICAKDSNSMKSANPNSGIYQAETTRTLDANGGNPSCNQGGMAVVCVDQGGGKSACNIMDDQSPTLTCTHGGEPVVCLQGSMIGRDNNNGPNGSGMNEDVSFTLNTVDKHAVVYAMDRASFNCGSGFARKPGITDDGINSTLTAQGPSAVAYSSGKASFFTNATEEKVGSLVATDYKDPPLVASNYIVRRLTPTECAKLQGFPDWWCSGLETEEPTKDDIAFWNNVFETHRLINGKSKGKTEKQIVKWLQNPHTDSAEYKMWGNGVALPCVCVVLQGIVLWS